MPCGGIFPCAPHPQPCWQCDKPGFDHMLIEWDSGLHADCVLPFLQGIEGEAVLAHEHEIEVVFPDDGDGRKAKELNEFLLAAHARVTALKAVLSDEEQSK